MKSKLEILPSEDITLNHKTVRISVTDRLRSYILSNQLSPGEKLTQDELAIKFGVSRTPIREALHKLADEGLVTLSPFKGAIVSEISLRDLEDLYAVRIPLEGYAVSLAAIIISENEIQNLFEILEKMKGATEARDVRALMALNYQFNGSIFMAARKKLLYDQCLIYMRAADKYRWIHFSKPELSSIVITEHHDLLMTLVQHDPKAAEELSRVQNLRSMNDLIELLQLQN